MIITIINLLYLRIFKISRNFVRIKKIRKPVISTRHNIQRDNSLFKGNYVHEYCGTKIGIKTMKEKKEELVYLLKKTAITATLREVMRLRRLKEKHERAIERYIALRDSYAEKEREAMSRFKETTGYDIEDIAGVRKDENGKDCFFLKTNQYINENEN